MPKIIEHTRHRALLVCFVLAGCAIDITPTDEVAIRCTVDADCPTGLVCVRGASSKLTSGDGNAAPQLRVDNFEVVLRYVVP